MASQDIMSSGLNRMLRDIAPHAAVLTELPLEELTSRIQLIRAAEVPEVNSRTYTSDQWQTFSIDINQGLMLHFHKMVKLFVSQILPVDDDGRFEQHKLPEAEFIMTAKSFMASFWHQQLGLSDSRLQPTATIPLTTLTASQVSLYEFLLYYVECFVVAHELAHVTLKIGVQCQSVRILTMLAAARKTVAEVAASRHADDTATLTTECAPDSIDSWAAEIACDMIATGCLMAMRKEPLIMAVPDFVFVLQNMLETFLTKVAGVPPPLGNHPPSAVRLFCNRLVQAKAKAHPLYLGRVVEQMAANVLTHV